MLSRRFAGYIKLACMNGTHVAALVCFGVALLLYLVASSSAAGGGFALLGFVFELIAWSKLFGSKGSKE